MKLYVAIKNSILVWDTLTGQLHDVLQNQSNHEIISMSAIPNSGKFVVGDAGGSIYLRKLDSGIEISKIHKLKNKVAVNHLLAKRHGSWNESVIIGVYQDCEVFVFGKAESNEYSLLRHFNAKRFLSNATAIISAEYEEQRNLLILGSNKGDILCLDIDKTRVAHHLHIPNLECIKFVVKCEVPLMLIFGKSSEIVGAYLPPHSKKYKSSCHLVVEGPKK
jgi:hypothetical protein